MTGSFFNPGPYAGYLAGIFPATLGFYLFKINFPALGKTLQTNIIVRKTRDIFHHIRKNLNHRLPHFITNANSMAPSAEKQQGSESKKNLRIVGITTLSAMVFMVLVFPASRSRAAWIAVFVSSVYLLFLHYKDNIKILLHSFLNSSVRKVVAIILLIILTACLISGLYFLKKGSVDGRLLIWKVSCNMIKDKPVLGYGFDQFKAHYMDYQAAFFEQNPGSEEAMVAGDNNYAFNELLQQTVENGIVGLILILLVISSVFIVPGFRLQVSGSRFSNICRFGCWLTSYDFLLFTKQGFKFQVSGFRRRQTGWEQQLLWVVKAGVISIMVFAFFSYPTQILPIKLSLVLYLATIASLVPQKEIVIPAICNKRNSKYFSYIIRPAFSILIILLAFAECRLLKVHTIAFRDWNSAYKLYQLGAYDACIDDYEKAYPVLKSNGDFLTNYGKALSMAEKHIEAVDVLKQAAKYYPNTVVYTALGDNYKKLNKIEQAEEAYIHAWYMNPSRFYPKYLLAKLYDESGQRKKAVATAHELLNKEIKIESTAIEEIKTEMNEIITKNKEGN